MGGLGISEILIIVAVPALFLVPLFKIFQKAGYPGAFSLTLLVPALNIFMLYFLAFGEWPVLKELKALKQMMPSTSSGPSR